MIYRKESKKTHLNEAMARRPGESSDFEQDTKKILDTAKNAQIRSELLLRYAQSVLTKSRSRD